MSSKLFAYNDPAGWGKQLVLAGGRVGCEVRLFSAASELRDKSGVAFVCLDQQGPRRDVTKQLVNKLWDFPYIKVLQSRLEADLYDDKYLQAKVLHKFMPKTILVDSIHQVSEAIRDLGGFPVMFKAPFGASSKCVEVVDSWARMDKIGAQMLSDSGMVFQNGRKHSGNILLQKFYNVPGDYRIVITGDYVFGLARRNKPGTPFASGSGLNKPLKLNEAKECFIAGIQVAREINSKWLAMDFIVPEDGKPLLLEVSSSWTPHPYALCQVYTTSLREVIPLKGGHMFDMAIGAMQRC